MSSYKVELSAPDYDYHKEQVESASTSAPHLDYDANFEEKSFLHVCIRTMCVIDSNLNDGDMTTSIAGAHGLMFLAFADRSNRLCEHDTQRLKSTLRYVNENSNVSLLVLLVSPFVKLQMDDVESLSILESYKQQIKGLLSGMNKVREVHVVPLETNSVQATAGNYESVKPHWQEGPAKTIVQKLSEENLVNGIKWLLHNRPVCPPLKRTLLRNIVEEWGSFLPLTSDKLDPGTMLSNFNVLLATASCLLTQKEFCHLSSGVIAPEFLPKNIGKADGVESTSLRETYLNWNSSRKFERIRKMLHASMLYGFPKHDQNVQNSKSVAPFFKSYRDMIVQYVSKLGHGRKVMLEIHELFNFARNNAVGYTMTIPWGPILDVLIKAQITRLNEYVVFPSHVDDYNSLCQAMCHARSTISTYSLKSFDCIPMHCLLKVDYLLANNDNSCDRTITASASKSGDVTGKKRGREIAGDTSNENLLLSTKRSRVDELDFAVKEEQKRAMSYENQLLGLLEDGELGLL